MEARHFEQHQTVKRGWDTSWLALGIAEGVTLPFLLPVFTQCKDMGCDAGLTLTLVHMNRQVMVAVILEHQVLTPSGGIPCNIREQAEILLTVKVAKDIVRSAGSDNLRA